MAEPNRPSEEWTPAGQPAAAPPPAGGAAPRSATAPPAAAASSPPLVQGPRAELIHDRLTIFVVRSLFFLVAGGLGFSCALNFGTDPFRSILFACVGALVVILGEVFFSKTP